MVCAEGEGLDSVYIELEVGPQPAEQLLHHESIATVVCWQPRQIIKHLAERERRPCGAGVHGGV